ncbi:MAG: hypothetical protein QF654_04620 [Alphaproteobacteria bacterium]|jgi:hypothetical protein|nr:hypothetical protein [Alphaproteobacteria bacterium]|tara:strand:+ start:206 stop:445 length:240 start_codon:yes stop_codon:yes gene_type:complete
MSAIIDTLRRVIVRIIEFAVLLAALGFLLQLLYGGPVPFFGDILGNLIAIIAALETSGFIGLVAAGVVVWLLMRKTAPH